MKTLKLKGHESSQCHINVYPNHISPNIEFISYTTMVISLYYNGTSWMLHCTGTYSATTRKQMGYFMSEYVTGGDYFTANGAYETGVDVPVTLTKRALDVLGMCS